MKQREEEAKAEDDGADEEADDWAADAEQARVEAEEAAAAAAVGDATYVRVPSKLSVKRRRRDAQRRRALTGEEWAADALLCWSFEAKVLPHTNQSRGFFLSQGQGGCTFSGCQGEEALRHRLKERQAGSPSGGGGGALVWLLFLLLLFEHTSNSPPVCMAQGDVLATLEEHAAAVAQYKLSVRHLVYLRKTRAVDDARHAATAQGLANGLTAEQAAAQAQDAVKSRAQKTPEWLANSSR